MGIARTLRASRSVLRYSGIKGLTAGFDFSGERVNCESETLAGPGPLYRVDSNYVCRKFFPGDNGYGRVFATGTATLTPSRVPRPFHHTSSRPDVFYGNVVYEPSSATGAFLVRGTVRNIGRSAKLVGQMRCLDDAFQFGCPINQGPFRGISSGEDSEGTFGTGRSRCNWRGAGGFLQLDGTFTCRDGLHGRLTLQKMPGP